MTTGTIILPVPPQALPDGSASNAGPAIQIVKSSASAPAPYFAQMLFDQSTREQCMWGFRMPQDYASSPVMKIIWKTSVTSNNVIFEGRIAAYTPGTDTTDIAAKAFASANTSSAQAAPSTTAGKLAETSITLTNADSLAANDYIIIYLARDAANGSDTIAADVGVVAVSIEYTTV